MTRRRKAGWLSVVAGMVASLGAPLYQSSAIEAAPGAGQIQLFTDVNFDNVQQADEDFGPGGVRVNFYTSGNVLAGSNVSNENGIVAIPGGGPFRAEVVDLNRGGLTSGQAGSTFTIPTLASNASVAIPVWEPHNYNGGVDRDMVVAAQQAPSPNNGPAAYEVEVGDSGLDATPQVLGENTTGSVNGLAYDPVGDNLFAAAWHKRFSPYGPLGPGGVYRNGAPFVTIPNAAPPAGLLAGIPAPANGDCGVQADGHDCFYQDPSVNPATQRDYGGQVAAGRAGLGEMDIYNGDTLFVTNLGDGGLYPITDIDGAGAVGARIAIPTSCAGGGNRSRPGAVKVQNGLVYVGTTCQTSLEAQVHAYDPENGTWTQDVWTGDLSYNRPDDNFFPNATYPGGQNWTGWEDGNESASCIAPNPLLGPNYLCINPQPFLMDIEFLNDGSMIMGIRDRFSDQTSGNPAFPVIIGSGIGAGLGFSSGDTISAARVNNLSFTGLYHNITDQGWSDDTGSLAHAHQGVGSAVVQPGSGDLTVTQSDPIDCDLGSTFAGSACGGAVNVGAQGSGVEGGLRTYSTLGANAAASDAIVLFSAAQSGDAAYAERNAAGKIRPSSFGKGGGLGDIVLLTAPAPVEIGNRVWNDVNNNGIQDPGEAGINGVTVQLVQGGSVVGTTTTSGDGNWAFDVTPGGSYTVRAATSQGALTGYVIAPTNVDTPDNSNQGDNDATLSGGYFQIAGITAGQHGQNNHTYDIGLVEAPPDLALEKLDAYTSVPNRGGAPAQPGDVLTWTIQVTNQGTLPASDVEVIDYVPAVLEYVNGSQPWAASGSNRTTTIAGPIAPGASATVTISLRVRPAGAPTTPGDYQNDAEIFGFTDASGLPDEDSTPDQTNGNDEVVNGVINDNPDDGTDEDDHDIAEFEIVVPPDAALIKVEDEPFTRTVEHTATTPLVGDIVHYNIAVTNQGVTDLTDVVVTDYLPEGTAYYGGDVAWATAPAPANSVTTTIESLPAGATVNLGIDVQVTTIVAGTQTNVAEIRSFVDEFGLNDIDSTPDFDPSNDITINDVNDLTPGTGDEDDADPEEFPVTAPDPAIDVEKLIRTFDGTEWVDADTVDPATGFPYAAAFPNVEYQFLVTNPGNVPLANIELTDDVIAGWALRFIGGDDDGDNELDVTETWEYTALWPSPPWEGPDAVRTNVAEVTGEWEPGFGNPTVIVEDDDPATYWTRGVPDIEIVKRINGFDANTAPGVPVESGEDMSVTFEVKNTGTAPLEEVIVTDDTIPFGDITCPKTELAPSEEMLCTAPWPAPDLNVQHTNTAQVDGVYYPLFGDPEPVSDDDPANAWTRDPAGIHVEKYISFDDADTLPGVQFADGDTMDVRFEVTNTGEAALSNITLIDDVLGDVTGTYIEGDINGDDLLDLTETWVFETTYPAPAPGEQHQNIATVTGDYTDLDGTITLTDADPANAWTPGIPQIEVIKYINGDDASNVPGVLVAAGSLMDVTFDVTNIGNVELINVVLFDDTIDQDDITCPLTVLAAGESMTCEAQYPAPFPGDQHTNVATVTGDYVQPDGQFIEVDDSDPANAYVGPAPSIDLVKYINYNDANEQPGVGVPTGSDMTITFEVTNTGGVDLENVEVNDDVLGAITCPQDVLAVGESMTCETTYAAPAPGTIHTNTGDVVADWTDPITGEVIEVTDEDPANAWTMGAPRIDIVKYINGEDANREPGVQVAVGSDMDFEFVVTNVGDVPLENVRLTDNIISTADINCPQNTLAVGESMTCDATYPAPEPGVQHSNIAEVTGSFTQPNGQIVEVSDDDPANAWTTPPPAIDLTKYINDQDANVTPGVGVPVDSTMTVRFSITNTGGVALDNLTLVDDVMGDVTASCPQTTLAVAETIDCVTTWPAPDAGEIHANIAVVEAEYLNPVGADIPVTDEDPAHAWTPGRPAISLVKTINSQDANSVGEAVLVAANDPMLVEFIVTNTGDVALSNVTVTDDVISNADISCPQDVLAVGESMTCEATYPGPVEGGSHVNTGTATGEFVQPNGQIVPVEDDDPAHAYADSTPDIQIVKYINGDDANARPGVNVPEFSTMDVTFEVTNLQPVLLENVVVVDDVMGAISCPMTELAPAGSLGDSMICTGAWPAPNPGEVHTNVATVVGDHTYPNGIVVGVSDNDPANAWVTGSPQIEVIKFINDDDANLAPGVRVADGDTMQFRFEIRNTGNVTLTDVWLFDDVLDQQDIMCVGANPATPNMIERMAAGEVAVCTATGPAPGPGGFHTNTAEVEGSYIQPDGTTDRVNDSDPANAYTPGGPSIDIEKYITDTDAEAGFIDGYGADDQVTLEDADTEAEAAYVTAHEDMLISYVVTNTGDVTLENVLVSDPTIGTATIFCTATILAPGEETTCTANFPAPAPGTFHTNTGYVRGDYRPPAGTPVQVRDDDPAWAYVKLVDVSLDKEVWTGGLVENDETFIDADEAVRDEAGIIKLDRAFQYRITVRNDAPGARPDSATQVTVADVLDVADAIEITGYSTTAGSCDLATGVCDLGTMEDGDEVVIIVDAVLPRANVAAVPADGFLANDAQVATLHETDIDSVPGNGFAPVEDDDDPAWVEARIIDLELVKMIDGVDNGVADNGVSDREDGQDEEKGRLPVAIGEQVTWTIQVANRSEQRATGVTVNDVLPDEFVFVEADGAYDEASDVWTVGAVEANSTVSLNIEAVLAPDWAFDQDSAPADRNVNVAEIMSANEDDRDSFVGDGVVDADDIDDAHADTIVGALGDFVWVDANGNGMQDAGEEPVAGVEVVLTWESDVTDSNGVVIVPSGTTLTTVTADDGSYMFTNLYGGDYRIDFDLPAGFVVTASDIGGDDAADSDADAAGVINMTLAPGAVDPTNDVGIYEPVSIGDFVWMDYDRDGMQEAGEPALAGVTVRLIGVDGLGNEVEATQETDLMGRYLFDGLRPGTYRVEFDLDDGYELTMQDQGDDHMDSDADASGSTINHTLVSGDANMTLDAGVYETLDLEVLKDGRIEMEAGGEVVWRITVTNYGIHDAMPGAVLTDRLPAGLSYADIEVPAGWECETPTVGVAEGGMVTCTSTEVLAAGESVLFRILMYVDDQYTEPFETAGSSALIAEWINTVEVAVAPEQVDINEDNNASSKKLILMTAVTATGLDLTGLLMAAGLLLSLGGFVLIVGDRKRRLVPGEMAVHGSTEV